MRVDRLFGWSWLVLVLAGCDGILPPPPPPVSNVSSEEAVEAQTSEATSEDQEEVVPRGPTSGPDHYKVKFETSKGDFVVEVHRDWAALGADHFFNLVKSGFYDHCKIFLVNPGYIVQFGINGDPEVHRKYSMTMIDDDIPRKGVLNIRGRIAFAVSGERNARTTQLFINYKSNTRMDVYRFTPFGEVVEGMDDVVDQFNSEYGEAPSSPQVQQSVMNSGNAVLDDRFPNLDYIKRAVIIEPAEFATDTQTATEESIKEPTALETPSSETKEPAETEKSAEKSEDKSTDSQSPVEPEKPAPATSEPPATEKPEPAVDQPVEPDQPDPPKGPEPADN